VIADAVAAPNVNANELESTGVSTGLEVNRNVKFPAVPVIPKPTKVATPLDAVAVATTINDPVPDKMAAVTTVALSEVSTASVPSRSWITGC
jgi:hypothetical protein